MSKKIQKIQAVADVFITALKSLPRQQREHVILKIAEDAFLSHDMQDSLLAASRLNERTSSYDSYRRRRTSGK